MKEYAIYPFRVMNITQNYDDGNHVPHWKNSKNHSDKPWDEACKDSGRSYFEPQNDFIIEEVLGINSSTTNTVRLKSVNKLYIPYKKDADYLYITLTHMNEDNLKKVKKGDILKKGTKVLMEGTDGQATGNHFHITANLGKYYGLLKNSNGKWCYTYDKSLLPHEAFYVDSKYTTIKNSNGSKFKEKPTDKVGTPVSRDKNKNQLEIIVDNLRVRNKGTTTGSILGYANKGIYNYSKINQANGYTWYEIESNKWVGYNKDWIKLYKKEEVKATVNLVNNEVENLKKEIEDKNTIIKDLNQQVNDLLLKIKTLENKIEELQTKNNIILEEPIFTYTATKTDKFVIDLNKGEELRVYER